MLTHGPLDPRAACDVLRIADAHRAPRLREAALDAYAADPEAAAASPGLAALPKRLLRECLRSAPARKRRREEAIAAGWPDPGQPAGAGGAGEDACDGALDGLRRIRANLDRAFDILASPPPRGPPARQSPDPSP